ncbi:MAG: GTPase HflX [Ruminococcaceae bacterium]|nr:GTPase HflX [Oscillospiraceae bacterium]MBR3596108.1 GTPase HflX [Clostridia bacterium]
MEFYDNTVQPEKVLLISVDTGEFDAEVSVNELSELVKTAGGETAGVIIQKRPSPDSVTYIGSGKLEEAKEICENCEIDVVVCDGELSPTQGRVLEKMLKTRVIDRTVLILDIFARNARSGEGKLQVELAQLKYSLPRLSGQGTSMSRLGGGIGTRGPGETKLESDKRHIRRRIHTLEENLKELSKRRERHRERRKKDGIITAAIVGYTNAGKSTLLNTLTDANVLAENKLFATLDPTARAIRLPDGNEVMLIDTVGFISRLPHFLVEAFKSTLEEATNADILIILCDASDSECEEQLTVTKEILKVLGGEEKPMITVYNKCDIAESYLLPVTRNTVKISALKGIGIDSLLECIADNMPKNKKRVLLLIPFSEGALANEVRKNSRILKEEYRADGIFLDAITDVSIMYKILDYIVKEEEICQDT